MSEKMKGITVTSVYDEKKFISEVNDEPSETVTTGYIPIDEQVKMIIRGEVTIGNLDRGFEDATDDIDSEDPSEVFEDATDYATESELSEIDQIPLNTYVYSPRNEG